MTYPGIENDPAALAADPDRAAVEARRKEQAEEFGTYVAVQEIPWGSVPAFFTGEPVPASTVERYGWLDLGLVAKTGTKAAEAVAPTAPVEPEPAAKTTGSTSKSGGNG